ncbi:hypothetical protein BC830DRAFT_54473 [Chytriomyces sp. MP71]|nr:hypothetical protein BC830DRAFT_54473 [Chytriomyces sp. MP71]
MASPVHQLQILTKESSTAFFVEAGSNSDGACEGFVTFKLASKLKSPKILLEFRGHIESRWEYGGRLAQKLETPTYKVNRVSKTFQRIGQVLHESKDTMLPSPMGDALTFPFHIALPKKNMPPTYESNSGCIHYSLKCSILYADGLMSKGTKEVEVPIFMQMPEMAKISLLTAPNEVMHQADPSADKCAFNIQLPTRCAVIGDALEVNLGILQTPGNTKLRLFRASLRLNATYTDDQENKTGQAKFPRPLSELSQSFPLVKVGGMGGVDPIYNKFHLAVDPEMAQASFESVLISVKTILRVDIVLDNSEAPNILLEIPIIILPQLKARRGSDQDRVFSMVSRVDSVPDSLHSMQSLTTDLSKRSNSMGLLSPISPASPPWPTENSYARQKMNMLMSEIEALELASRDPYPQRRTSRSARSSEDLNNPRQWSPELVQHWIRQFDPTPEALQAFAENQINGAVLLSMNDDDLKNVLHIQQLGFRRKLLLAVAKLPVY